MGKPFSQELQKINETYKWALQIPIKNINEIYAILCEKPLFIVGSGGSSSACSLFSLHHQNQGLIASDITPLELQYAKKAVNKDSNVVFISASGKNSDILFAFDTAIALEPNSILSICLQKNSELSKKSSNFSLSKILELENPSGKDGFLATNSLIAYFTIISRIYGHNFSLQNLVPDQSFFNNLSNFSNLLHEEFTITVLYAGWGKPVALDIESKFSESGIGNILVSDYRNFGHGRHNWFDKKKKQSAIVALVSDEEKDIARKTLELLPNDIPILIIDSNLKFADASLELLAKSLFLVEKVGILKKIDPGRPGVPSYGSKLYKLRYSKLYNEKSNISAKARNAIMRKLGGLHFMEDDHILNAWKNAYDTFIKKINKVEFRGFFLDYDGTLCSSEERFTPPRKEIADKLNFFLSNNILVGIVTGRGKSVREELQKLIKSDYWDKVIIGYYNGAQIATLENNSMPIKENTDHLFFEIEKILRTDPVIYNLIDVELRQGQITVLIKDKKKSKIVKNILTDFLHNKFQFQIQILESSHSIDIISIKTSKNLILEYYAKNLGYEGKIFKFLCIGDRGKYPGNDYQLLSNEYSLSVDQVSNDPYTCWNLTSNGNNCVEATLEYFDAISPSNNSMFKIKL